LIKTTYNIKKMDCPSEESLIKIKLEDIQEIQSLEFDIDNRMLSVFHSAENPEIEKRIQQLNLGCSLQSTSTIDDVEVKGNNSYQSKLLWAVLIINFAFFIIEMTTGLLSKSMGLVADSLDMFADTVVYGLSLWAVGSALSRKKMVARMSGYFQILLALLGITEVIRRFINEDIAPNYQTMIIVSVFALLANAASMMILRKTNSKDAHIQASKIFTSNDIIINIGVIIAGFMVMLTQSLIPDLIIGTLVFLVVLRSSVRILQLGK